MRRAAAALLVVAALGALVFRARPDRPVAASLAVMGRFWRADARTRLYNSVPFAQERPLALALLRADASLPLDRDARVCVPLAGEETRRRAAFLLAPRRVVLVAGCATPTVTAAAADTATDVVRAVPAVPPAPVPPAAPAP